MTKTEVKILQILWNSDTPMCAYDIIHDHSNLKEITVRTTLANMLKKDLIRVEGMVHRTKSYARAFVANVTPEEVYLNYLLKESDACLNLFDLTKTIVTGNYLTADQKEEIVNILTK